MIKFRILSSIVTLLLMIITCDKLLQYSATEVCRLELKPAYYSCHLL